MKNLTLDDVESMRFGAEWWVSDEAIAAYGDDDPDSFEKLRDECLAVADAVEAAIKIGDDDAVECAAAQWPDQAGPWK